MIPGRCDPSCGLMASLHEGDDYSCILAMDLRRAKRW